MPQVVCLLHAQPQPGSITGKLANPQRHFDRDRMSTGQNSVQLLPGDPHPPGRFTNRDAQRR